MDKEVFISYKAEEYEEARWVRLALEQKGISCWMAPESIRGGSSYASEIPAAIRGCKAFVLILSEKVQESKWVPRELDQAINDNKIIMPFMIENCSLKDEFAFYLANVQRYHAYAGKEAALARMIVDIRELLGIAEVVEPEPEESKKAEQKPIVESAPTVPDVKPEEEVLQKTDQKASNPEKPRSTKKSLLIAGAVLAAAIVLGVLLRMGTTVKIAGETISKKETYLSIYDTELTVDDVKAIAQIKNLATLRLENCVVPYEQVGEVLGDKLSTLDISGSNFSEAQIESIDFSAMPLTTLDLSGNKGFTSLEPLAGLSDTLVFLNVSDTSLTELRGIEAFSKLRQLSADRNGISDIAALSACTALTNVSLNGNQVKDLSAFEFCSGLTELSVDENELTNLKGLEHALKLQKISACSNQISSLDGLENATLLETVDLRDNQLTDVSILGKSAVCLERVYLGDNAISDLSFLQNSSELLYLNLDRNEVTSLKALANATLLQGLTAAGNQIENTEGIEGKEALKYLNLADNNLKDVGVKTALTFHASDGVVLDLSGNQLDEVHISYENKYYFLALSGYVIPKDSFLYTSNGSYVLFDYNDDLDFEALAEKDYYDFAVVGCPLDQQVRIEDILGTYMITFVDSAEEYYDIEKYMPSYIIGD